MFSFANTTSSIRKGLKTRYPRLKTTMIQSKYKYASRNATRELQ